MGDEINQDVVSGKHDGTDLPQSRQGYMERSGGHALFPHPKICGKRRMSRLMQSYPRNYITFCNECQGCSKALRECYAIYFHGVFRCGRFWEKVSILASQNHQRIRHRTRLSPEENARNEHAYLLFLFAGRTLRTRLDLHAPVSCCTVACTKFSGWRGFSHRCATRSVPRQCKSLWFRHHRQYWTCSGRYRVHGRA